LTILAHPALLDLIDEGVISADKARVGGTSIDIHLGPELLVEDGEGGVVTIDPSRGDKPSLRPVSLGRPYLLEPGEYVLAVTQERFRLPDDITAHLYMRSSLARAGLNHLLAFHIDPGWAADTEEGRPLTMELHNVTRRTRIVLREGLRVAQVVFHRHEPVGYDHLYANRGRYGRSAGIEQSKGSNQAAAPPERPATPSTSPAGTDRRRPGRPRKNPAQVA
jgi:dCTP deaminase